MSSPAVERPVGAQRPRIEAAPAATSSAGAEAVELAALAGLDLDPWQAYGLDVMLRERHVDPVAEDDDGLRWAAFEVGLLVARQNGKGGLLEARELSGVFLFGEKLITHTAHEFATSLQQFGRVLVCIESAPDLDREVRKVTRAHGEEGIELKNGARLLFRARTNRAGRGFSGDVVVLDEAMYVNPQAVSALMPTMIARRNPQMIYVASAPDIAEHPTCHALAALRARAQRGGDESLCWLEWSPDYDHPDDVAHLCDVERTPPGDPELEAAIAAANPALGIRITREAVENERRSMSPRAFAVEQLSVGAWPRPEGADQVIDRETWAARHDPESQALDPVAFAVDVTPDRTRSSIATAGWRPDGRAHVEVIDDREGTGWVVERLAELVARWDPCSLMVDALSPAASLLPALAERDLEVDVTSSRQMAGAVGGFYDDVANDRLRYRDEQDLLTTALKGASTRVLGDAWAWDRRGTTPISPLVAATLARWGLVVWSSRRTTSSPASLPTTDTSTTSGTGRRAGSETYDLALAGF